MHVIMLALDFSERWRDLIMNVWHPYLFRWGWLDNIQLSLNPHVIFGKEILYLHTFGLHAEKLWTKLYSQRCEGEQADLMDLWSLFADDCLIFTQRTKRSADRIAHILEEYCRGSGQMVNKQKSLLFSLVRIVRKVTRWWFTIVCKILKIL